MTDLQNEFEKTGGVVWINSDAYPDGKIYTKEYTEWMEKQADRAINNLDKNKKYELWHDGGEWIISYKEQCKTLREWLNSK